jgi:hypothetical protein
MSFILLIVGPGILALLAAAKMPLAASLCSALWLGAIGWSVPDHSRWIFYSMAAFMLAFAVKIL